MQLDLADLSPQDRYKLLTAIVIPRPVAWVTTVNADGLVNAAPYSFFNLFGQDPATVILGIESRKDGSPKDTTRNILESGEFVVNIATPALNEVMVATAAAYTPDRSETDALGLPTLPSAQIRPPRLADAPVALECRLGHHFPIGPGRVVIVGEAVGLAARDGLIDTGRMYVNWNGEMPVARLYADRYAKLVEIDRRKIPAPLPAKEPT